MNKKFSIIDRIISFKYALQGLKILIKEEHNAWIHLFFMLLAIGFGFIYSISLNEWIVLILLFALVFLCELFNSAIENLCNYVQPEKHELIGKVKDLASAAVLVSAIAAFIIGLIIFIPKVF